jgi:hypothetical protein
MSAIALGSLAGVMFCCLAVRYFYGDHQSENDHGLVAGPAKIGASPIGKLSLFPDIVQLDDDNQSLANTTLGEHTAGRKPAKKTKGNDGVWTHRLTNRRYIRLRAGFYPYLTVVTTTQSVSAATAGS